MIDIHAHILPGLDDGAQTLDEASAMARAAAADGVQVIVATPHGVEWGAGCTLPEAEERLEALRARLAADQTAVHVLVGLENYIAPDLARQVAAGTAFALNRSPYFLIELPLQGLPIYTEQVIFELQAKGLLPILAHPERNSSLQESSDLLVRLVQRGVLAQVTAASLLGSFGSRVRKVAESFVSRGLVQIIASDAHSADGDRSPLLSEAVAVAAQLVGADKALAMVTTMPAAIVAGQEITVPPPAPHKPKRTWAFWR